MYKMLLIGDVHAKTSELEECNKLIDYIEKIIKENNVNYCFFSGDLYHYHNVIHLPVLKFWQDSFNRLARICKVISLVGNHDFGYDKPHIHALLPLKKIKNVFIVDSPQIIENSIYAPYMLDKEVLVKFCNENSGRKLLFCHETFVGAQFENGFYAPNGIDQYLLPQSNIIAGHIHRPSVLDKVVYIGAPRWQIITDANTDRNLHLITVEQDNIVNTKYFPTNTVCTPIYSVKDTPESPFEVPQAWGDNFKLTIDIHGPIDYVNSRKKYFEHKGYKVKPFPTKNFKSSVQESEGINKAFNNFTNSFVAKNGTSKESLLKLALERISWQ